MGGTSIYPEPGLKITGKYGKYLVKENIGHGGNGAVFAVDIIERGELLPRKEGYAVKFLVVSPKDKNELEKRKSRFKKEIQKVLSFQDEVEGIVPIYDTSVCCQEKQELLWYLMPLAEVYKPKNYSVLQRLEHMFCLGHCIKQLHEMGYAHRDIKPKNLLIVDGRVCLADFGLVWNIDDMDEHITEVNDRLGPQAIRPPELQPVEKVEGVDYRKSDVYLYAKTIWMVLHCNNNGFSEEYSRTADAVYIDRMKFGLETAEPLHRLMEGATRHNYWERIAIDDCLYYIENQLRIISGDIPQDILLDLKYAEQIKRIDATVPSDEKIFKDPSAILKILNSMSGIAELVFIEMEKEYVSLPLRKAKQIRNKFFAIEVLNPYNGGKKKTIELAIENICMKNIVYEIQMSNYGPDVQPIPVFTHIIEALKSSHRHIRLNAGYLIRMVR